LKVLQQNLIRFVLLILETVLFTCKPEYLSVVSYYGLDSQGLIHSGKKGFSFSRCLQAGSGAHPSSCQIGTGVPILSSKAYPGNKTHCLVTRSRMSDKLYALSSQAPVWCVVRQLLIFIFPSSILIHCCLTFPLGMVVS
jgi:hypothetical protein